MKIADYFASAVKSEIATQSARLVDAADPPASIVAGRCH
jgi:hypothetical protein